MAPLTADQTQQLPYGSELMFLPDRMPILHNLSTGKLEALRENPYQPGSPLFPVAAFNSPGYCRYFRMELSVGIGGSFALQSSLWTASPGRICGI